MQSVAIFISVLTYLPRKKRKLPHQHRNLTTVVCALTQKAHYIAGETMEPAMPLTPNAAITSHSAFTYVAYKTEHF